MKETVGLYGASCHLVGILATPDAPPDPSLPGIVLLNAGFLHRVGPNRLSVTIARRLAERGHAVLRFDFSGIGDSPAQDDPLPFAQRVVGEAQQAMDDMAAACGTTHFVVLGLCTGADIALQVACQDPRVLGAVLINAQGDQLGTSDAVNAYVTQRKDARYYWQVALRNPQSWGKLLRGQIDYRSLVRVLGAQLQRLCGRRQPAAMALPQLFKDFQHLCDRGVCLLLVYSQGDPGFDYLQAGLGARFQEVCQHSQVHIEVIPQTDHMLTLLGVQQRFLALLQHWLQEDLHVSYAAGLES